MNKNNSDIIRMLHELADVLEPFMQEIHDGARVWNGKEYVKVKPRRADPYALAWWSSITSIAEMIEFQSGKLTLQQLKYIEKKIFGGMGSFSDFRLDVDIYGDMACEINKNLDIKMNELYKLLKNENNKFS